jgi:HK97 family phage portal protein
VSTSLIARMFGATAPSGNPLDDRYYNGSGSGYPSATGIRITGELALRVGAVYRCVSILANALAMLPLGMFEALERGRRPAKEHPLDRTISLAPNRRQTTFEWRRQLMTCLLLRQNAFCQIVPTGEVGIELVPLHPDRLEGPEEISSGALRWQFKRADGTKTPLVEGVDLWHLQGLSEDGLRGLAMIDLGKDTVGLAAAAEQHAARFYERGITFQGILEHPAHLKPDTADAMSTSFSRKYGGLRGSHSVPVLWEGMKFNPISMSHKDAEFLDSRKFEIAEIARWFGVPPHMVGDVERSTSWGTGIESQGLQFLIYSLQPWLELWEEKIRKDLVVRPERYYAKFNPGALLRMDQKTQAEVCQIYIQTGVYSPNEVRELLERNPREGGDEYQTQLNMRLGAGQPGQPQAPPSAEREAALATLASVAERLAEQRDAAPGRDVAAEVVALEETRERERAAAARASVLARWCATRILEREADELRALATKTGGDAERWRHAVASFYGRHATYVAEALTISQETARAYCREQQERVLTAGVPASGEQWLSSCLDGLAGAAAAGQVGTVVHLHAHTTVTEGDVVVESPAAIVIPPAKVETHVTTQAPALASEITIRGPVDVRVREVPIPTAKEVEVTERDRAGRIKRTIERPKR